jgi:hypothetical protein
MKRLLYNGLVAAALVLGAFAAQAGIFGTESDLVLAAPKSCKQTPVSAGKVPNPCQPR